MTDEPVPIPAATVVIFRDRAGAPPELLMVERSAAMVFAGGAMVFPGGRVDPGDHALAAELGLDDEDGPGRIAAVRESIEEAGVAPGVTPGDAATITRLRGLLHDGSTIGAALEAAGAALDPQELVPFARWLPLGMRHRIFDTRFYLARLPDDAPEPSVDATENSRLVWTTAAVMLAEADAGRATIIFPTRRNLERLALFDDFHSAVTQARAHAVRTITPWFEDRGSVRHLCIPDDLGYPVTAEPADTVRRA
ncbi:NUDIX hydrolase [Sphingomonas sp. Leaf33]|uniref:NUDIX hydrolase n=1 Tax=Sphingomonas sp. Leaf33 TaxID=1736215 RepID=UPI0006F275E0|nr:NUDIX domain-containing protein [Sphingomonas sp. Leaf33]KQN24829.1 NUDIX hydrolase [Sphingomonas sp. Leaf33]